MMKFWRKKEPVADPVKEVKERSYFETIAAADVSVGLTEPIPTITSPELAMKLATAYRCTSILSGSIASLPLCLKRKKTGVFAVEENSELNYLLTVRPNNRQTAYELKRNAIIQMVNFGNAYIYPEYGLSGDIKSLTLLSPNSVTYDKFLDTYIINDPVNNIYASLECEDIIHLRNMSLDGGYTGVSTIRYAATVMGIAAAADQQNGQNFKPGNTYRGFISGDDKEGTRGYTAVNEDQLDDAASRFRQELESGKSITYLPGMLKFNTLSMSPADVQLLETKKFSVLDICRFYGVHPDKVFAGQSQNYKASEMSQVQYMTDTLQPLLRQIENEFLVKLIPREVSSKYKVEFDLESFYQTDLEAISSYNEKLVQNGLATVNELRAKQGRMPINGGDQTFISCNVAPINSPKIKGESVKNENNKI